MPPDSSRENRREESSVLNTVINTRATIRIVRSLSIPPEKLPVLKKFYEIVRREAGSRGFSEVTLKAIEEYIKNHEEGNPQLKLTPFVDEKAPSPAQVLCLHIDGVASGGKIHCRQAGMWIKGIRCYPCKNNRLRKSHAGR